ncbi:Imm8 family immunity protein [Paenibacillus polymyxa]|uniref:Imm8 family immunity protein n=1 Tax=Paenibacillus polymyxa TaxID=1406 RepID=A0AAE9L731_PAEPO|nr:Imm8 family immunity protein [Paenibacillus polymyxa]URJ50897.1 Imm8 family immunity protein [Paenibacillus polymyxa]
MLIIKALTKMFEDWGEDIDDFYITYNIDIGPSEINGASDMFSFELIRPKRLARMTGQGDIIIGHGHFIARDFNEIILEATLNRIINKCVDDDMNKAYKNLSAFSLGDGRIINNIPGNQNYI